MTMNFVITSSKLCADPRRYRLVYQQLLWQCYDEIYDDVNFFTRSHAETAIFFTSSLTENQFSRWFIVSFAAVISGGEALREDPNNGCEGA